MLIITIDESTDATDTAQLGILITEIFPNFERFEYFLCLILIKGRTIVKKYS